MYNLILIKKNHKITESMMEMFYDEKLIFLAHIFIHTKRVYTSAEEDLSSAVRADLATVQTEKDNT